MARGGYREAVEWIALNDETAERDPEVVQTFITTALIADLFRKDIETVARDVLRRRAKEPA